jgi:hypothetical protein
MAKDIGLVVCYFGQEWPAYFSHFLASCLANPEVDFLIFTNLAPPLTGPNTHFTYLADLAAFNALASSQLDLCIALTDPYKLCDLKPAYGVIFADYLQAYRFWGYCDIDLVFGDIRSFITDEVLRDYDVVSAVAEYPAGFFLLLRNVPTITQLYTASRDYKQIFQSLRHFCFDECNFKFGELLGAGRVIEEVTSEIESMAHVVSSQAKQGALRFYARTMGQEFMQQQTPVRWEAGKLYDKATGKSYLLVHLVNVKTNRTFSVEPWQAGRLYYVSHRGLTHSLRPGWATLRRNLVTKITSWLRHMHWLAWSVYQPWRLAQQAQMSVFDGACYLIGNLKCTFYFQERNRYCIISEFEGQTILRQCQVLAATTGCYLIREQRQVSLLKGAGEGAPFKIELLNLQSDACEVGYLLTTAPQ